MRFDLLVSASWDILPRNVLHLDTRNSGVRTVFAFLEKFPELLGPRVLGLAAGELSLRDERSSPLFFLLGDLVSSLTVLSYLV